MFGQIDYVIIGVSNMDRSITFYKDVLGIPLKFKSEGWTEFQTGATTLALHPSKSRIARAAAKHGEIVAGTSTIGFTVADVDKAYHELRGKKVTFVMEPTLREEEGQRLAVFLDPDGFEISLSEAVKRQAWAETHAT